MKLPPHALTMTATTDIPRIGIGNSKDYVKHLCFTKPNNACILPAYNLPVYYLYITCILPVYYLYITCILLTLRGGSDQNYNIGRQSVSV